MSIFRTVIVVIVLQVIPEITVKQVINLYLFYELLCLEVVAVKRPLPQRDILVSCCVSLLQDFKLVRNLRIR